MGLLDRFRGGDGDQPQGQMSDNAPPPVDEVRQLSQDGYSEEEITDILRDEGYSFGQINEALNQAVRESVGGGQPPQGGGPGGPQRGGGQMGGQGPPGPGQPAGGQPEPQMEPAPPTQDQQPARPPEQGSPPPAQPEPQPAPPSRGPSVEVSDTGLSEEVEEMIEIIVKEHFTEVEEEFANVYAEIDDLQARVEAVEKGIEEMKVREDEDEKEFIQKVDEIEEYIQSEQSQLGGMERAFEQVLPSLVENVRELSELVKEMKEEQPGQA